MARTDNPLPSWNDTATRRTIIDFVESVTQEGGSGFVRPEERVAVLDNDGTLWCEQPMPIQLDYTLLMLARNAEQNPGLRERQPWKAVVEKDHAWLGGVFVKHYHGDDSDLRVLMGGILNAFAGMSVEQYETDIGAFFENAQHPSLGRPYVTCGYKPMVELLRYLEANSFANYIASGGDRDFMRVVANRLYGVPRERVIGSTQALQYQESEGGTILYKAEMEFFDDGPTKPVRIWSRIGRRPILAFGNSNGDVPMLDYAGGSSRPALRLLLLHDDADREFDYTSGAESALERAKAQGWTVVSIENDWKTVFAD